MFLKTTPIVLVAFFAVFVTVEALRCYSCTGQNNSPCYLGNSSSPNMVLTNCTIGSSHCYATTSTTNVSSTMQRGCSFGCNNPNSTNTTAYRTNCCTTDFCNSVPIAPTLQCYSCLTTSTSPSDSCYSGNSVGLQSTVCPPTSTHCSKISSFVNGVTTTSRGCHQNCVNSASTECCSSSFCNKAEPPFQCYQCSTFSNATTDACFTGNISNPIMTRTTCANGVRNCYKESIVFPTYTSTIRGCRSSSCSSNGCTSCSSSLCNTGALSTSGSSLIGFIILVVVSFYKLF